MTGWERAELRRRTEALATPPTPREASDRRQFLAFSWSDARYLLAPAQVRETGRITGLTRLPASPPELLGIVTVRSEGIPLVDPRRLLGIDAPQREVRAVVVLADERRSSLALPADDLETLTSVEPTDLHTPGTLAAPAAGVTSDGRTLLDSEWLLDLPPFFDHEGTPR